MGLPLPNFDSASAFRRLSFTPSLSGLIRLRHLFVGLAVIVGTIYYASRVLGDEYVCSVEGDLFRYDAGVRLTERTRHDGPVSFELAIRPFTDHFQMEARGSFIELLNPGVKYDHLRSDPVNAYFVYDQTDPVSRFRTVSSLVLNKTSGDINLFHHRWIPPSGWETSDLYEFSGHCKRK